MTEYYDRDAIVRATVAGGATARLGVGTGIAYSFTRHPLVLATAALDAHEATEGRFALGLGTGTRGMRRRWFGIDDERVVDRMRETVDVIRSAWRSRGSFSYHGNYVDIEVDDLTLGERAERLPSLPVFGSGLNAAMVTAAATWCDGLLLHPMALGSGYWGEVMEPILAAAADTTADIASPLWLAQWVVTAVDNDPTQADLLARRALTFYLATASYRRHFASTPWATTSERVINEFKQIGPRWEALARLVPAEMVREYCLAGTPDMVRAQVAQLESRLEARGVDELVIQVAATGLTDEARTRSVQAALEALGPTR